MSVKSALVWFFLLTIGFEAHSQNEKWKAWEVEADTLLNRQDFEGAVKLYSKIIDASGLKVKSTFTAVYKRAICYYNLNDFKQALHDLEVFMPEFPDNEHARLLRAFVYKGLGDADHQLADLNALLASQPANRELLQWRASVYLDKGKYPDAKIDLLAVKAIQDDAETEMFLGTAYYYDGHPDSALLSLNKAIEMDATYLPSYLYAGFFSLQENEYELSVKYLNLALKLDPANTAALFYKGVALVELKQEKEGCRCLTKAFNAGEDDAGDYLKEYCYEDQNLQN
jgi:tetratricopeptide (TPR) repeat protein